MTIRHLQKMFSPASIAIIGASPKPLNIGYRVIRNLMTAGFDGPVMPVNPTDKAIAGILAYPDIKSLPVLPDLCVLCSDAPVALDLIESLGNLGVKAVMILSAVHKHDDKIAYDVQDVARRYKMRILGPNSMGAIIPGNKLNASTLHLPVSKGKIAFISQSGEMASSVLDWANAHGIGFSHFITLGDCHDIDIGDVIDYLGSDPFTRAILIYMETIHEKRNFMSAARASARNKPILVMKTGKYEEMPTITQSHTGAMAQKDLVYDAAFARAGMLRVNSIAELFAGAETLSMNKPFNGDRLVIIGNGAGLNVLAQDHLLDAGGTLSAFSDEICTKLKSTLPADSVIQNPLVLGGATSPEQYAKAYEIIAQSGQADCVLFLHAPSILEDTTKAAQALVEAHKKVRKSLITCWLGEETVADARHLFEENDIPSFTSPRMAVSAFMHIVQYRKNQVALMETPERVPAEIKPARSVVKNLIRQAVDQGERWLKEADTKAILKAYGIEIVAPYIVQNADEAIEVAHKIGFPVVVKIMSPDIVHKSDVGGVVLSLQNEDRVEQAIKDITDRVQNFDPDARIDGFIIQKMHDRQNTHELIAGMTHDPVFGPVILFGQGGTATEIIADHAIALPPLNMRLAKDLISRTKISKLLKGYRDIPAVDMDALCQLLIEISEICIDFPEIQEMDINPIFSSDKGALAVDARIRVQEVSTQFPNRRLAIRPYPADLEEEFTLRDGRKVLIRPIRPEDEPAHNEFLSKVTPEDIRFRFFGSVRELPHSEMARLTQLDYDREMAFVAQAPNEEDGHLETLGVVRTGTDPNNEDAEYAILVRSDLKGQKLGWKLLNKMIEYCRSRGTTYFTGQILRENRTMIDMVKAMGFEVRTIMEEDIVEVKLKL
ncbi:bifunctional acetate--CoA ligase family protein/GNAT family N-acetyltransferase [Terasakiella sp. A23]|uniref:bifunctional acetate--CoA ligase family protein/GNAT family N-acetyltransferase n=1 Tax=Terasakiella sp. FCG-A23 TaxID=3080561 RepID=UPI0029532743|nr:bifunctional acetate--CoA ligase family protein/GNAT family N-acetyltransferase [Terasakiella sp. A23]MDV7338745.1 bifunctional acetate--CoA ligase family protein/GNAT family N-acetyltransferase [Terasakiella sp. A23]